MRVIKADSDEFSFFWCQLYGNCVLPNPLYQSTNLEYYKITSKLKFVEDKSFVVVEQKSALLGLRMMLSKVKDGYSLSVHDLPIYFIERKDANYSWLHGSRKLMRAEFDDILNVGKVKTVHYNDRVICGEQSYLTNYLITKGAVFETDFVRVIDLAKEVEDLRREINKSFKSQISWGRNNLDIIVKSKNSIKEGDVEAFRSLHIKAAGRETRSVDSWDKQYSMVMEDEGFLVMGYWDGSLVSAALFSCNKTYCYYGVSASNRELFKWPISHGILWEGVLEAKRRGCSYFEAGEVLYENHNGRKVSNKELGITTFKKGFGGKTYLSLNVRLNL
jgi:hypothetical protein